MSSEFQPENRRLPWASGSPGPWKKWEKLWLDLLNAGPLVPWPNGPENLKKVSYAKDFGVFGGKQYGIDITAKMDDGSVLAVQCKDHAKFSLAKGIAAMDKAEQFVEAQAYYLALTADGVDADLELEASRRGNWMVVGLDTLSSWFFSGQLLPSEKQKRLVRSYFGESWVRELFPISSDELLISSKLFFQKKNLIQHDAKLQGEETLKLADTLASAMCGSSPRVVILKAAGGQGKTRLLKEVAELVEERCHERRVLFLNEAADLEAEDYGLRAEDLHHTSIFIDDAHRLENLRSRLLRLIADSGHATLMIAARPNSIESLKLKLLETGFVESEWQEHGLPILGFNDRRAIASELLGERNDELATWLAEQSKNCPLVCTVGAELFKSGRIQKDLIGSPDFKRRVFDHLMNSSLDSLFANDALKKERAEQVLRIFSLLSPVGGGEKFYEQIAQLVDFQPWEIERLVPQLEAAGLLRSNRGKVRVVPDLLADHLVYDTAYGSGKMPSLVRRVISLSSEDAYANLFGNLAEAEWRAKQDGCEDTYLNGMWKGLREILKTPEDPRLFNLLKPWRKFAIFQPERTLELARVFLDHETSRVERGVAEVRHEGFRYDAISMHLTTLPELLAPVAIHHACHRKAAFDLLWQIGCVKDGPSNAKDDLPTAWQTIAQTASLAHWDKGGPKDAFEWLKLWAARADARSMLTQGRSFLSQVACQWFEPRYGRSLKEADAIWAFSAEISRFRHEVLSWIEVELVPVSAGYRWAALNVVFSAGRLCLDTSAVPETEREVLGDKSLKLLQMILDLNDDPLLRLSIWQYLSRGVASAGDGGRKNEWLLLRNSIPRDLPFQLVRLAGSFAIHEWNHEQLQKFEKREDWDVSAKWWMKLASQTIDELRHAHPSLRESLAQIDQVNSSLVNFRQRACWDMVAEAWSARFPHERSVVIEELLMRADHALVPCLGYFVGLRDETNSKHADEHIIRALSHANSRVRRAILHRLSWRDVKRRKSIAQKMKGMATSRDAAVVSDMASFIVWNRYEASPYLDEVLACLNFPVLLESETASVGEAIANLLQYAKHTIHPNLLNSLFQRLKDLGDLNKEFSEQALLVFHEKFPCEMFQVYLARVRVGRLLPWLLDSWVLSGLPEGFGDEEYEKTAKALFDEAIAVDEEYFNQFRQLFDVSVARVKPEFAAALLIAELEKKPRQAITLKRVVALAGSGHGSAVYDSPEFAEILLENINRLPAIDARRLRDELIFGAVPHTWGSSGGRIDEEYLWAKDRAEQLAEQCRSNPILRNFYLSIVKNQEELVADVRRCSLNDD